MAKRAKIADALPEAARCHHPGHVIHMSLDHTIAPSESVAQCDCGWEHRVVWSRHTYVEQDAACAAHWAETDAT